MLRFFQHSWNKAGQLLTEMLMDIAIMAITRLNPESGFQTSRVELLGRVNALLALEMWHTASKKVRYSLSD